MKPRCPPYNHRVELATKQDRSTHPVELGVDLEEQVVPTDLNGRGLADEM